jgi:uncharacterized protein (TIGR02246 family)
MMDHDTDQQEDVTMTAPTSPAQLMTVFAQRAARGDADGLLALYEPDAVFEPERGVTRRGPAEIASALEELAGIRPQIRYDGEPDVVVVGDVALVSSSWRMEVRLPDGTIHREGGLSADVLRRQADGTWRVLIDQPRGATLDR